jgi:hypothetical protein
VRTLYGAHLSDVSPSDDGRLAAGLAARDAADWDDEAAPYLKALPHYRGSQWTDTDVDTLLRRLQDVGYGWPRADGVRARLTQDAE